MLVQGCLILGLWPFQKLLNYPNSKDGHPRSELAHFGLKDFLLFIWNPNKEIVTQKPFPIEAVPDFTKRLKQLWVGGRYREIPLLNGQGQVGLPRLTISVTAV